MYDATTSILRSAELNCNAQMPLYKAENFSTRAARLQEASRCVHDKTLCHMICLMTLRQV